MTKPRYSHIIVPKPLHAQLRALAQSQGASIAKLIQELLNQSINTTSLKTTYNGAYHPPETGLISSRFSEGSGETVGFPLVRPPGFEPGLSAREADVLTRLDYGRYYL